MTRSRKRKLQRRSPAGHMARALPRGHRPMLAAPACAMALRRRPASRRRPRGSHRHRAEARGEPAGRADQHRRRSAPRSSSSCNVTNFDDYVKFLPSVVVSDASARASRRSTCAASRAAATATTPAPLPSVGIYLDEQPITTIQGALDMHIYDIARVEALAGPQGTLYGASSQSGTIRIITNKPDPSGFEAGYDLEGNTVSAAAMRLRWPRASSTCRSRDTRRDPPGRLGRARRRLHRQRARQRTFPSTVRSRRVRASTRHADNARSSRTTTTTSTPTAPARALRIDLNDNWTITPPVMAQKQKAERQLRRYDTDVGELKVAHCHPEDSDDQWFQAALTVEGKIGNFDLVYAGSYLDRDVDSKSDYTDYSYWYDVAYLADGYYFSDYFYNDDGDDHRLLPVHQGQGPLQEVQPGAARRLAAGQPAPWHRRACSGSARSTTSSRTT